MIQHDNVCAAMERIEQYVSIHGYSYPLRDLYASVGINEEVLAHMIQHALEIRAVLEPSSFGLGLLFGLMASDYVPAQMTDNDFSELLGE